MLFWQRREALVDAAVRQDGLDPEHQVARHAVAQDVQPARVGGEVAADLARALRTEGQREQAVDGGGGGLNGRQHAAGLRRHRVGDGIDVTDAVHPAERQDHLCPGIVGDAAVDEASVAGLGQDADAVPACEAHHVGDLARRRGPDHERGPAVVLAPEVRREGHHVLGTPQYVGGPDDLGAGLRERGRPGR